MDRKIKYKDYDFMTKIIGDICNFALANGIKPDDALETVADSILTILEIVTFNNWAPSEEKRND